MLNEDASKLIDNVRQEWKTLKEYKSYKVYEFMSIADSKKNYYKIILLVNVGESFNTTLLNGPLKRKFIKLNENKLLLDEAGFTNILIF